MFHGLRDFGRAITHANISLGKSARRFFNKIRLYPEHHDDPPPVLETKYGGEIFSEKIFLEKFSGKFPEKKLRYIFVRTFFIG